MKKQVKKSLLLALAILLTIYGVSFADYIRENIFYDYYYPVDAHTYDYASVIDFCDGDNPDVCPGGIHIGTNPSKPDSSSPLCDHQS
jgi:hypothetical protein